MAQYWCDIYLWEFILNTNPQIRQIIELGTWLGGFSLYLNLQAQVRNMSFITYDSINFNSSAINHIPFIKKDVFADADEIGEQVAALSTILLCDNGNKPRELKTFAPYLTNDSIIVVHDWMVEFFPEDVPDYLEEIYSDLCDEIGSISRIFRKKVFH